MMDCVERIKLIMNKLLLIAAEINETDIEAKAEMEYNDGTKVRCSMTFSIDSIDEGGGE